MSSTAMVLAAGYGQRMRPLTLSKPKPLFEIGGRAMLDLALDKLVAVGIRRAVVNAHYLADQIEAQVKKRSDLEIILSREDELLDTGGGIKKALPYFGGQPFFALNADLPWMDKGEPSLIRMVKAWNPEAMDVLLLLMPTQKALGFGPDGDFNLTADGKVQRNNIRPPRSHVMLSAQILKPELFAKRTESVFSNRLIWDEAEAKGRLAGVEHQGTCYHVGTADDWQQANELLKSGQGWAVP